MSYPFAPAAPSAAERFAGLMEARLAVAPFDARLGCELVHVSTSDAVAELVARFQDLDDGSQAAVLAKLEGSR